MTLCPAEPDSGVVFVRTDKHGRQAEVQGRFDNVCDTALGTTLRNEDGVNVATVEHLCAALWGAGIDNVRIELGGPEVPIMDGSAYPFVFLIECAGIVEQPVARRWLRVRRPVEVSIGSSRLAVYPSEVFSADLAIEFDNRVIDRQTYRFTEGESGFKREISRARTFGFVEDVERMHAAGLALGGSLDNAVVVGDDGVLNEEGLRYGDEFVRHKLLDCIGDFYLTGHRMIGHVEGVRPGHRINNELLRAVFADRNNWSMSELDDAVFSHTEEPSRAIA